MKPSDAPPRPEQLAGATPRSWYLVYAKPRMEPLAEEHLTRQGYRIYLPRVRATHRLRGRYRERVEALFPRYLFIHLDQCNDNWGPIRFTQGVAGMVRFGGVAACAPDALITSLRANEDAEGIQQQSRQEFQPGERVRITDGVLCGYEGIFTAHEGRERVAILLDLAGRCTTVHLSAQDVHSL